MPPKKQLSAEIPARNIEVVLRNLHSYAEKIRKGKNPEITDQYFEGLWTIIEAFLDLDKDSPLKKRYDAEAVTSDYITVAEYRS